MGQGRVRTFTK